MNKAIIKLQQDAINDNVSTMSLLRTAYLVARKLEIADFVKWIEQELNGYNDAKDVEDLPLYRRIRGVPKYLEYDNRWTAFPVSDLPELAEIVATMQRKGATQAIPILESLLTDDIREPVSMPLRPDQEVVLNQLFELNTRYTIHVSQNYIINIIESVKNKILEWAITLEENGIVGEGLMFTSDEKKIALTNSIYYINIINGNSNELQIQQNANESSQMQNA